MLKEVIVKRTFEIEKRLMEDVKALEKQVLALEEEKKTLQWDAKRLQLALQEISSKHEKVCHQWQSTLLHILKKSAMLVVCVAL